MALTSKGIFVIGAKRTPFCKYGGSLRELPASYAFAAAAKDAIRSANVDPTIVDCTIVGNINFLSQCDGGKTPRYCGIYSGVPIEKPALGVNKACGTGLQAIISSAVDIAFGTSKLCLTGGTELMSTLPLLVRNVRFGTALGTQYRLEDHIKKEFPDSYCGLTRQGMVEKLAEKYKISREDVDYFVLESNSKWKKANDSKLFKDELTSLIVTLKKKDIEVKNDEVSQPNINAEELATATQLTENGRIITAANSAAPADGAAALLLANEEIVTSEGYQPIARIVGWTTIGVPPEDTPIGATQAIKKLLHDFKLKAEDVDLFEINEIFAPEVLVAIKVLNLDPNKINVDGGALAMGHPVSATGARIATHLVHRLRQLNLRRGIAASSCGGGQGIAVLFERVPAHLFWHSFYDKAADFFPWSPEIRQQFVHSTRHLMNPGDETTEVLVEAPVAVAALCVAAFTGLTLMG